MAGELDTLTGPRKAAIFLATVGAEASARIFRELDDTEIEILTAEISKLPSVDDGVTSLVLREFLEMAVTKQYITTGGLSYALEVLEKALGQSRANEVIGRIQASVQPARFAAVKKADPNQLASMLIREHPQTVALILANLDPTLAATLLGALPDEIRAEIVFRLATIDKTNPDIVKQIEQVLEKQVSASFASGVSYGGGAKTAAEVLNRVDPTTQKMILNRLDEHSPTLAEQIRGLMFTFEDLGGVDDRSLQKILQAVEQRDLVLSLKAASDEVKDKIFRNMSDRTASAIKQEIEFLGPVRLKDVEEAQRAVVSVVRRLEEAREIVLTTPGTGEEIVA
jgi:flagellar motor switch protein FliG